MSWKQDVFTILLIIVTAYFANQYLVREGFDINSRWIADGYCTFLDASDTRQFLLNDPDGYTTSMSNWDLYARKSTTELRYRKAAAAVAASFDAEQKIRLRDAAKRADAYIRSLNTGSNTVAYKYGLGESVEIEKLLNLKWVFALTHGTTYEDGLPHTRANIIFLSSMVDETPDKLAKTLVHEKIHLYQRMYPERMVHVLEQQGFVRWKSRQGVPRIRANPDLDPYVYINPATESPMLALYTSDTPDSVSDITIIYGDNEHPYEAMAYELASDVK